MPGPLPCGRAMNLHRGVARLGSHVGVDAHDVPRLLPAHDVRERAHREEVGLLERRGHRPHSVDVAAPPRVEDGPEPFANDRLLRENAHLVFSPC